MDFQIITDWGMTGLGTLGGGSGLLTYTLYDVDNNVLVATTNVGVREHPAGSGLYDVKVTWNPDWTGIKVVWTDGTRSAQEWFDSPITDLFIGPSAVTFVFKTNAGSIVPSVQFTVVGVGSSSTNPSGTITLNLSDGSYEIRVLPTAGNTWPNQTITVSGDGTFNFTANPITVPSVPSVSYSSTVDGDEYFESRLYSDTWSVASDENKQRALNDATRIIDRLNYKGVKTVSDQSHEWPRSKLWMNRIAIDPTTVPNDILYAQYEIAFALLNGYDPERDMRTLGVTSRGYSSVRIAYDPKQVPDYIRWGIPSLAAWQYLLPYINLEASGLIRLHRVA